MLVYFQSLENETSSRENLTNMHVVPPENVNIQHDVPHTPTRVRLAFTLRCHEVDQMINRQIKLGLPNLCVH